MYSLSHMDAGCSTRQRKKPEQHTHKTRGMATNMPGANGTGSPTGRKRELITEDELPQVQPSAVALVYYPVRRWRWRQLPPPAFLGNPRHRARDNVPVAVVDGTRICVSSGAATYCFDTVAFACEWSKAGDWVLPFRANAEHVPELGLWLGLSARRLGDYNLCSMDLAGVATGSCD
ncbi:hypothetical protein C2845_PM06G34250 [Panicum miliaceum]|uniref:Uncharacterized protein n=1 Tax=Panicum miliaceum TaxID=4540 RepID=A0A3L6RA04_PANMI|nr:hypothetical protein C2845_PM06G34250 [Panicum miliaceum]